MNEHAPLGDHLYILNSSVHSTDDLSSCLFNSTGEHNIIIQPSTMMDIAPPVSIIDPHPPAQDSSSVRLHGSDSDTFYPLLETPTAALTTSMDAFSILVFLRRLVHFLWPSSKLFVGPPRSPPSVRFVNVRALRPSSVRIGGTAFLSFVVELLTKIGTQSEMERKW